MRPVLAAGVLLFAFTVAPAAARAEAPVPVGIIVVVPDTGAFYDVDFAIGARCRF